MSRTLSLFAFALCLSAAAHAASPVQPEAGLFASPDVRLAGAPIAFDDDAHGHYFRYQRYLATKGLAGETSESWGLLDSAARRRKLAAGEAFLEERFQELMAKSFLSDEETEFLKAVWGEEIAQGVKSVAAARELKDPEQIRLALDKVSRLSKSLGNVRNIDWKALFDGAGGPAKDYLAPEKPVGFLDKLDSPEIRRILASEKSFSGFLKGHERSGGVDALAIPPLMAMYQVHTRAPEPERAQLAHLLPTLVQLLRDGKKVALEDMPGALGFAVPGDYDRPERLAITPLVKDAEALVVADVLTHELQHIYDMYTGRYYTLDSELRSFKGDILFHRALAKVSPERYRQLQRSNDDMTRRIVDRVATLDDALEKSPAAFAQNVAFGAGYSVWREGGFFGRVSLREAVDPVLGAPREIAALRMLREQARARVRALERRQDEIRAERDRRSSRELDQELEKVSRDLQSARGKYDHFDGESTLKELRVRRMQSEVEWLDKNSRGADKEPFDLHLAVDKKYVTP